MSNISRSLKRKSLILSFFGIIMAAIMMLGTSNVYAYEWSQEECEQCKSKNEDEKLYIIDSFYATPNMDSLRVIKDIYKFLIWEGTFPKYDTALEIYMDFGEYPKDSEVVILQPHRGYNQAVYSNMTRIKTIESYDGKAEYLIGMSSYDQIVIIVDGNTYSGDIGALVNDFLTKHFEYQIEPEFYLPYKYAAKAGGCISFSKYKQKDVIYSVVCQYLVGFNLTKDSTPVEQQFDLEEPAIYGGNDELQIDDTPTEPESTNNTALQVVGIVISSILSVVGIYLIYLLIKKIYKILKG